MVRTPKNTIKRSMIGYLWQHMVALAPNIARLSCANWMRYVQTYRRKALR